MIKELIIANPTLSLVIISMAISFLLTISYKFLTNQKEMRRLKEEMKELQQEIKKYRSEPKKMMKIQNKLLTKNLEYSQYSMRANFMTMIPLLLIFAYLNNIYSYYPIKVNETFPLIIESEHEIKNIEVFPKDTFKIINKTTENNKLILYLVANHEFNDYITIKVDNESYKKRIIIQNGIAPKIEKYEGNVKKIEIGYKNIKINLLGLKIRWIWAYMIFSIIFSSIFRKLLNVY